MSGPHVGPIVRATSSWVLKNLHSGGDFGCQNKDKDLQFGSFFHVVGSTFSGGESLVLDSFRRVDN